jgi:hypothetical protein
MGVKKILFILMVLILINSVQAIDVDSCRTLDQAGETYDLIQDLSVSGRCFDIIAPNIILDLNGHTINLTSSYGIGVAMSSNAPGSEVMNGEIYEVSETVLGNDGIGVIVQCDQCKIHDMTINLASFYMSNIRISGGPITVEIYDNDLYKRTTAINEDMTNDVGMIDTLDLDEGAVMYVYNNLIDGKAWQINNRQGTMHIYNNNLRPVKRNRNAYSMRIRGSYGTIHDNTIISDEGMGLFFTSGDNYHVYNNFVNVSAEEMSGYGLSEGQGTALRVREIARDNLFENNTFIYRVNPASPWDAVGCHVGTFDGYANDYINNTCMVITSSTSYPAPGFNVDDTTSMGDNIIRGNIFRSNHVGVRLGWDNGGVNDLLFDTNTIERIGPDIGTFYTLEMYRVGGQGLMNNTFLNTTFINNNGFDSIRYGPASGVKEFIVAWYLDVYVEDSVNNPVANAQVTIRDNDNDIAFSGTTDSTGFIPTQALEEFREVATDNVPVRTFESPYSITVVYSGETLTEDNLVLDHSQTITFTLGVAGNIPPVVDNTLCEVNSAWVTCDGVLGVNYGSTITRVRAHCTDSDGTISGVSFSLTNVQDGSTLLQGAGVPGAGDIWTYNNPDITITDSGDFSLVATCTDNGSATDTETINWFLDWGTLSTQQIDPTNDIDVDNGENFNFATRLTCNNGECGDVTATLDPTFGNTVVGSNAGTSGDANQGVVRCGIFQLSEQGTIKNITSYTRAAGANSYCAAAVYDGTSTTPNNLLAQSGQVLDDNTLRWRTFTLSDTLLDPGYYSLCLTCDTGITFHYDTTGGNMAGIQDHYYPFPDPFSPLNWQRPWIMSIYANYETGAAPPPPKTIVPMGSGTPFYTTDTNPTTICQDLKGGETCDTNWNVVTNVDNGTYDFYVIYEPTEYPLSTVNSQTIVVSVNDCVTDTELIQAINNWYEGIIDTSTLVNTIKGWMSNRC